MRAAGVIFDLDGTLVDSRRDLATAINVLRARLELAPLAIDAIDAMVGEGSRVLVRRALPPEIDGRRFEDALASYLDVYYERCLDETAPYAGVPELLAELAPRCRLAVLTNKPERHSRKVLAGTGLAAFFPLVVGGDTLPVRKPDPAGMRFIAEQWRLPVAQVPLVGDSAIDAATAAAAGAPAVLVGWGYGRAEQLAGFAATCVRDLPELRAALLR